MFGTTLDSSHLINKFKIFLSLSKQCGGISYFWRLHSHLSDGCGRVDEAFSSFIDISSKTMPNRND